MIQRDSSEASERKGISNVATDEMPQPVGSCEVIGNGLAPDALDSSTFGKPLDTAAAREMTTVRRTPSKNCLAL